MRSQLGENGVPRKINYWSDIKLSFGDVTWTQVSFTCISAVPSSKGFQNHSDFNCLTLSFTFKNQ